MIAMPYTQARGLLPDDTRPVIRVAARDLSAYVAGAAARGGGTAAARGGWGVQSGSPEADAAAGAVVMPTTAPATTARAEVPLPSSRVALD